MSDKSGRELRGASFLCSPFSMEAGEALELDSQKNRAANWVFGSVGLILVPSGVAGALPNHYYKKKLSCDL